MQPYNESTFLFAEPSFLSGIASIVDLNGSLRNYNTSATPEEADERALAADWRAVGKDIENAIETEKEN